MRYDSVTTTHAHAFSHALQWCERSQYRTKKKYHHQYRQLHQWQVRDRPFNITVLDSLQSNMFLLGDFFCVFYFVSSSHFSSRFTYERTILIKLKFIINKNRQLDTCRAECGWCGAQRYFPFSQYRIDQCVAEIHYLLLRRRPHTTEAHTMHTSYTYWFRLRMGRTVCM